MYQRVQREDVVRIPPERLGEEIVEGTVVEILKFGAFVRFGPLDGLLHISQVMDDRVDVDEEGQRLIGKDTKRDLRIGDKVRTRIVAVSLNERAPRESKIGQGSHLLPPLRPAAPVLGAGHFCILDLVTR